MSNTAISTVKEESRQLDHMNSRLNDSLFSKDLAPHYMKLAGQLASSNLVPKGFQGNPQNLFICWALGYQIGMSPEQAMQCIAVINGKPAMWGDDMLALCMVHKDFEDIIEEPILARDGSVFGYKCTVKRKGMTDKVNKFDLNDAKKAGLLAKGGVWTQYPERMLKLRARGFSLRDAFPDALKGIKPREEVEDYIEAEYKIDEDNTSRTQLLKKDYLNKTGKEINEIHSGSNSNSEDTLSSKQNTESDEHEEMESSREETIDVYSEIRRLIDETLFPSERLTKALSYYEVNSIEELSQESAQDFYNVLLKQ